MTVIVDIELITPCKSKNSGFNTDYLYLEKSPSSHPFFLFDC